MPVIITLIIAMFLVLISWTWHNLGNIEPTKKIITISGFLIIIFIITFIMFNISKGSINYEKQEEMEAVRTVLVIFFTIINGLILMPSITRVLGKIHEKEIEPKQAKKRVIIIFIVFFVIMFLECGYMKSIQQDILKIYNEALLKG